MSSVWVTIVVLALATAAIRAAGPLALGGRELPAAVAGVVALVAPALLAALVVTETLAGDPGEIVLDERLAGVAAAGGVLALRGPLLVALALAAGVTAGLRALG
jgi:branched-subunit amino acid transport protein